MTKKTSDCEKLSNKIGVMGGAFDPIHYGHLQLALEALEALSLREVLFIPTGISPHKTVMGGATAVQRYEMTRLATEQVPEFHVSRIEIDRPGKSHTVDTLTGLRAQLGEGVHFYLLLGMDSLCDFPLWKKPEEIQEMCTLVVASRSGSQRDAQSDAIFSKSVIQLGMPRMDIASSQIRERVRAGKRVDFLIPDAVNRYIKENRIYTQQ